MAEYKTVYTINHSEYGVLGVFSTAVLAMERAMKYVSTNGWKMVESRDEHYQDLCTRGWALIEKNPMQDITSMLIELNFVDRKFNEDDPNRYRFPIKSKKD